MIDEMRTSFGLPLRVAIHSDVGRVRTNNEDAYIVAPVGPDDVVNSASGEALFDLRSVRALLAVSDGLGGAQAGEVASAIVLRSLRLSLSQQGSDRESALYAAVECANRDVWTASASPGRKGMGATLTAMFIHGDEAHVAEVGDSRAYLRRGGQLQQITRDQSYVQVLLDAGALTLALCVALLALAAVPFVLWRWRSHG